MDVSFKPEAAGRLIRRDRPWTIADPEREYALSLGSLALLRAHFIIA